MKKAYWWALAGLGAIAAAPAAPDIFAQIGAQIETTQTQLKSLDGEQKALETSEQAQIFASEAEKKQRARIESDITKLMLEGEEADRIRQGIIDSGCPPAGGMAPIELADRCNPQVEAHRQLVERLTARMYDLKNQQTQVDQLRASISATVLENVQKRKRIAADRERFAAERERLQAQAVTELIRRNKLGAARACKSECCHRVIYDGADPKLCGVGLVCRSFQGAGLFGSNVSICGAAASATPVREAAATTIAPPPAKTKKQWEIEYEQKLAVYQAELSKQQQAVAQYQRDVADMERRKAELKAQAEQAQAAWQRAVAACRAGDYSQCDRRP